MGFYFLDGKAQNLECYKNLKTVILINILNKFLSRNRLNHNTRNYEVDQITDVIVGTGSNKEGYRSK
jgi:sulfate adenylyltransferase subunit 2